MLKKLLVAIVLLLVVGGGAFYFLVLKDDPAPNLTVGAGAGSDAGKVVAVEGKWAVKASSGTAVGFRIQETFVGGVAKHTAVGRTPAVTGAMTIAGTEVTAADITADLGAIGFTDTPAGLDVANRKRAIENAGLEIAKFPSAAFRLTAPIELGAIPKGGVTVTAQATGDLTLHGVTKSVTFPVAAKIVNGTIIVATKAPVPITLADYGMQPPTFGPVADVSKTGQFEFKVTYARA